MCSNILSVEIQIFSLGDGAILRLALHLDDLVLRQFEAGQKREPERETKPGLSTHRRLDAGVY